VFLKEIRVENSQIITMVIMLVMTGGMSYLIGDLNGFIRGMEKAKEIYQGTATVSRGR